jgi:hypothetical protein
METAAFEYCSNFLHLRPLPRTDLDEHIIRLDLKDMYVRKQNILHRIVELSDLISLPIAVFFGLFDVGKDFSTKPENWSSSMSSRRVLASNGSQRKCSHVIFTTQKSSWPFGNN